MGVPPSKMKKLSVCIPTFNRSGYLTRCLTILAPQVSQFPDDVEIVISDNCSVDDTKNVVDRFSEQCTIRYFKNDENIGGNRNILSIFRSKAGGEFAWIIGDDDCPREGSIAKLMEILNREKDIDYVYLNFLIEDIDEESKKAAYEGKIINPKARQYFGSQDLKEGRKEFDRIISDDRTGLCSLYSSVFRVSTCRQAAIDLKISDDFENLNSTFPHAVILIDTMHGKMAYNTGIPWLVCGTECCWSRFFFAVHIHMPDFFDYQEKKGIPHDLVERQRREYFSTYGRSILLGYFFNKLRDQNLPRMDEVQVFRTLRSSIKYPELYIRGVEVVRLYLVSKLARTDQ